MNNPFKDIQGNEKPSKDLRNRVLGDLDRLNLALDLADLFLIQQPKVLTALFTKENKKK
ncbi:hypothetical protein [Wenyingzhuangia sp. IMCC45574]